MRLFDRLGPQPGDERLRQRSAIDLSERFVEALGRLAGDPEYGQSTTGREHLGRLRRTRNRVHPMPTLTGDDRVESAPCSLPGFKGRYLDVHSAALRELGHPCVRLDAEYRATGRLKLPRDDARADAHIENESTRAGSHDPLDQDVGIARPRAIITLRV